MYIWKGFSAYIYLQKVVLSKYIFMGLFCLYNFANSFPAYAHLKRFFCLYIFAQLFCPYTFVNGFSTFIHLQTTFLPICICKGLFYSFTFAKGFFAHCQVFCNQSQIQTPFKAFLVTHWISGCQSSTASHTVSHNWPWLRSGKSISLTNCTVHCASNDVVIQIHCVSLEFNTAIVFWRVILWKQPCEVESISPL